MAKKKNSSVETPDSVASTTDPYRLKTEAVDALVSANAENSPQVTEDELRKYTSRSRFHLPEWLKAVLIKLWFAGAVCFFIFWGLGTYVTATLDMMFIFGIALGVVNDILVNNIFRFYEKTPGANDRWMMFPKKRFSSFFFNILYSFVILAAIFMLYNIINITIIKITGAENTVPLGVEPILFGVFYMMFDMLFIRMKLMFKSMIEDAKKKAAGK